MLVSALAVAVLCLANAQYSLATVNCQPNSIGKCVSQGGSCVDSVKNIQCQTVCAGSPVNNPKLILQTVTATQNGQDIDSLGGIDLTIPMALSIKGINNYGPIKQPLIDVSVSGCTSLFGCRWLNIPTFGLTNSLDACDQSSGMQIIPDCHLSTDVIGSTNIIQVNVDLTKNPTLSKILALISPGKYYTLEVTIKDGQNKLVCVDAADLIKKT